MNNQEIINPDSKLKAISCSFENCSFENNKEQLPKSSSKEYINSQEIQEPTAEVSIDGHIVKVHHLAYNDSKDLQEMIDNIQLVGFNALQSSADYNQIVKILKAMNKELQELKKEIVEIKKSKNI